MSDERGGYAAWTSMQFFFPGGPRDTWFDGRFMAAMLEATAGPFAWSDEDGTITLPTHGWTDKISSPFRGTKAPMVGDRKHFTISVLADSRDDLLAIEGAKAEGAPVLFCPGTWACDAFQATSGNTYTLTRPLASGIVDGVTDETHPTIYVLDGAETPDAASCSGQSVTAAASGTLRVFYLPVFRVMVSSLGRSVADYNDLRLSFGLDEKVSGDFE